MRIRFSINLQRSAESEDGEPRILPSGRGRPSVKMATKSGRRSKAWPIVTLCELKTRNSDKLGVQGRRGRGRRISGNPKVAVYLKCSRPKKTERKLQSLSETKKLMAVSGGRAQKQLGTLSNQDEGQI